jgi:hypothetical protein
MARSSVASSYLRASIAPEVKAKHANGTLEVRVPAPRVATPRMIEVTAD